MSDRGVYGRSAVGAHARHAAASSAIAARSATCSDHTGNGSKKSLIYLGIVGAGVLVGMVSWPYEKKPLGAIGLNASGVMVGAGMLSLLQQAVERWSGE